MKNLREILGKFRSNFPEIFEINLGDFPQNVDEKTWHQLFQRKM